MYAGRHRQIPHETQLRRPFARAVVVVAITAGMSGVGLLSGGRDDPRIADPQRPRPAVAATPSSPMVTAAELRTELRLTIRQRTAIHTALTRIARLNAQLQQSGLPGNPGVLALRARLRHRDSELVATEQRLTRRLTAAR